MKNDRRGFLKKSGFVAASVSLAGLNGCIGFSEKKPAPEQKAGIANWPVSEGVNTPKICV